MNLSEKQLEQENDYDLGPYHWFKNKENISGRLYFGYLSICKSFIEKNNSDNLIVLDAGCGDGFFCKELFETKKCQITGIDYSQKAISFARLLLPDVNFLLSDLERIPVDNETYDFIYLIEVLEHVPPDNIDNILNELHRVLKRNGQLIITVPSLFNGDPTPESKHYQHFTAGSLKIVVNRFFIIKEALGQDKVGFHILKIFYKIIDNKLWDLKILRKFYNIKIWPKFFNKCNPEKGRRIIISCVKNINN